MPNDVFQNTPVNRNARKAIFRAARLGTRPAPVIPNIGDAVKTIDVAGAYKEGWEGSTESFPTTVRDAWADRKAY